MKNILAENMLRFGVKNLRKENKETLKILIESLSSAEPRLIKFFKSIPEFVNIVTAGASQMSSMLANRQLINSMSNEDILYSILAIALKSTGLYDNSYVLMSPQSASAYLKDPDNKTDVNNLMRLTRPLTDVFSRGKKTQTFKQLNINPNNPGKIFAAGTFSAESGFVMDQKDKGFGQQTLDEIIDAINTYNLNQALIALADPDITDIANTINSVKTIRISGEMFDNRGREGKDAEWIWGRKYAGVVCYTAGEAIDPRSTTKADFNIEIEKDQGGKVPLKMPEEGFAKGKANLNMAVVNKFIQDIKAMGNPLSLDVVASASGGEFYNKGGDSSKINVNTGFPVNHDGKSVYDVTGRPTESGNASLANLRADELVKALQATFPKTKITKKAIITPGKGTMARYMKSFSQIEKPGVPGEVMTSMDLQQIVSQKGTSIDRGAGYQVKPLNWQTQFWSGLSSLNQFVVSPGDAESGNTDTQTGVDGLDQAARGLTGL